MADRPELTTVAHVRDAGSFLFTVTDEFDVEDEVIVVPCEDGVDGQSDGGGANDRSDGVRQAGVTAWINRCPHETQRFDSGRGVPMRGDEIVCPRHGSMFDACSGSCDNGEAAGTTLPSVDVAVEGGTIYLDDGDYTYAHDGGFDEGDGPGSTSHIGF